MLLLLARPSCAAADALGISALEDPSSDASAFEHTLCAGLGMPYSKHIQGLPHRQELAQHLHAARLPGGGAGAQGLPAPLAA